MNNYIGRQTGTNDPNFINGIYQNLMVGIWNGNSRNFISKNYILKMPTSIVVSNNCSGTNFECNKLEDGLEGFKLERANLLQQGDTAHPNHNEWRFWDPSIARINGYLANPLIPIDWFWDNSVNNENPNQYPAGVINEIWTTGYENCTDFYPCPECNVDRLHAIITDSVDGAHAAENEYYNATYVYTSLKDSLQLMYSGSTYDASLQNFFTLTALSNIGRLSNVNDYLTNNDNATAYLLNENISASNLMEANTQLVNRICAGNVSDTLEYDENMRQILTSIAYQLPAISGEAVYRARAILGLDLDDTEIEFRLTNTQNTYTDNFRLEPNPTNGQFTLHYELKEDETAICTVFDAIGKIISFNTIESSLTSRTFDLGSNKNGIYYLNIVTSSGEKNHLKIILIK